MMVEVIKRCLLSFLLLTALYLAWSLFVTGEKMKKLTNARDGKELFAAVEHKRGQPFKLARLDQQLPPLVEPPPQLVDQPPPLVEQPPPPPLVENPLMPKIRNKRIAQQPPPSPKGASGPGP